MFAGTWTDQEPLSYGRKYCVEASIACCRLIASKHTPCVSVRFSVLFLNEVITNFALLEYPFMHDGITHEEYDKERDYFIHHYEDYKERIFLCGNRKRTKKVN